MFNSKNNYKIFKQQQQIVTIEFPWQGREGSWIPFWNVRKSLSLIWRCVEGKVCKIHNMCINWLNLNLLIVVSVLKESFGNPIARNLGHGTPTRGYARQPEDWSTEP